MREHVTLVAARQPGRDGRGATSSLPPDLLRQVRQRVRAIALLMLAAFAVDPLIYVGGFVLGALRVVNLPEEFYGKTPFALASMAVVVASARQWWSTHLPVRPPVATPNPRRQYS